MAMTAERASSLLFAPGFRGTVEGYRMGQRVRATCRGKAVAVELRTGDRGVAPPAGAMPHNGDWHAARHSAHPGTALELCFAPSRPARLLRGRAAREVALARRFGGSRRRGDDKARRLRTS